MMAKKTPNFRKELRWFWGIVIGGIAFVILLFFATSEGIFGKLPTFEELESPENNLATEIISSDGKTIGKYAYQNRTPVKYKDLPKGLINALVSTEDERFYQHSGIDFRGTIRAIVKMGRGGGASTITQQLAKMLFTGKASKNVFFRIVQKLKEWVVAIKLERQYTKQEILTMYLNKYDFLNQAVGIRSASRIYFGKEPKELTVQESAMLVGMLKNSSLYNPLRKDRRKIVKQRRNVVIKQLFRNRFISRTEKDSLQKLPLSLDVHREGHSDGIATYFREHLRGVLKKWVKKNLKPHGKPYNIYRDGLKIYVTIDSRMQKYAEQAVAEHLSNLQKYFFKEQKKNKTAPFYDLDKREIARILNRAKKNSARYKRMKNEWKSEKEIDIAFNTKTKMKVFSWQGDRDTIMTPNDSIGYYKYFLRSGLVSIEPQTGKIKAWVGGIDNKHFKYDAVEQQKRQVGSTFKPFVYATAINQLKLSPCDKFPNVPYTIPKGKYGILKDWTPQNSEGKYGGELTLKQALANSVNVITARLIDMVTPRNVVNLAKSAGITEQIPETPAIALGTVDLSLLELVSAYSCFANKGLRVEPMMITRIEDKNGTVLEQFTPKTKEVLSQESAYVVINLLEGVTQSGTGVRLRTSWTSLPKVVTGFPYKFTNPIAGKTGTTQNQSDGWFMGVVPNLATGVWTGGEDRSIHFAGISKGQGATMALPVWALFMKKCYADKTLNISEEDFEKPDDISIDLNCDQKNTSKEQKTDQAKDKKENDLDF